jgi:glucose/arabinose dehydrogenase
VFPRGRSIWAEDWPSEEVRHARAALRLGRVSARVLVLWLAAATVAACGGASASTETVSGAVRLQLVGKFAAPLYVTAPLGDRRRIFVVEQAGTVRVVRDGHRLATPFLDIRRLVKSGGEQGLLSLAFAPDYASSGLFYVMYTAQPNGQERIVEYRRRTADLADPGSARLVLAQKDPEPNHNGGLLLFGPDKLLYVGVGDGGSEGDPHGARGNGQNLGTIFGKLLRIDPRQSGSRPYTVPASNPFVHRAGARPEIYAYGLRNPWRFSFDPPTGDLIIADVGQDTWEEIDFERRGQARGKNFGWRVWEGRSRYKRGESAPGAVFPVITERHSDGYCSITGGYVLRDPRLPAAWRGRYVWGDYCRGRIEWTRLGHGATAPVMQTGLTVPALSSFGEDASGRVYVTSLDGPVYRLVAR